MSQNKNSKYHHGDLRQTMIAEASRQISENGIESLSMRKLGELVGVSRTALYHHFSNKSDLLSAVAESGFTQWQLNTQQAIESVTPAGNDLIRTYITCYIEHALANPEIYDLMFGKEIWLGGKSSDSLHKVAYDSFQYHLALITDWQEAGVLPNKIKPLRLAQITWGTLHGLSKLFMDGIYADRKSLNELCDSLMLLLTGKE